MQRDAPLLEGEIYHIYNRGAHKADIFFDEHDYFRFKSLLFLSNTSNSLNMREVLKKYKGRSFVSIFREERPDQGLVDVLAYALMSNHFHLILRQKSENGITNFIKKLGTAYSMYFNTLREHPGTVFQGRFKSRHVGEGDYLRWLFAYVALNPLDVGFPSWKENGISDQQAAYDFLKNYPHASFPDMLGETKRPEAAILSFSALEEIGGDVPNFSHIKELFEIESVTPEF